jgi:hypothetical protein
VLDAYSLFPLGYSDIMLWHRLPQEGAPLSRAERKKRPVEEKETYKWILGASSSRKTLSVAGAAIIVEDRDGDYFEQYERIPDEKTFLLIRANQDRRLENGESLFGALARAPLAGVYHLWIDPKGKPGRLAHIEVRFRAISMPAPYRYKGSPRPLYAIEAREVESEAAEPVCWRLNTNWPVHDYETALQLIHWYSCRWIIEEVFRLLKKDGFNIEASELETGWGIRKLSVMMLEAIVQVLQMQIAYGLPEGSEQPGIEVAYTPQEQECLQRLNEKMEGKTLKQKNPYNSTKLIWAVWVLARLGGWKGYASQRRPGMATLLSGITKFYSIYAGWTLEKDVGKR